jgi:dihydropteroate synthase
MVMMDKDKSHMINLKGELVSLEMPLVMGILNITPDSFYDGGRFSDEKKLLQQCEKLLREGAAIIDVGAYSSRPGAMNVPEGEEWERIKYALTAIRRVFPDCVLSLDTFRAEIAHRAVDAFGVDLINDISGGTGDENMFKMVAQLGIPYVLMHMQGTPQTMQEKPEYLDVVADISLFFSKQVHKLKQLGVCDIILDPGFGFGKTLSHNYEILARFSEFKLHALPLLAGVSRKSMISKVLGVEAIDCLNGTSCVNTMALLQGANILRVHDVKQAVECIQLVSQIKTFKGNDIS